MLSGKAISMLDALGIALSSMMVVFSVLLILYVAVRLFPVILREKQAVDVSVSTTEPKEDDGELAAVIAAAIRSYKGTQRDIPLGNPLARNCRR